MKIVAKSQFCFLTILLQLQLVLWLNFFDNHVILVYHSKFHVEIFFQFTMIKHIIESFIQSENVYQY